MSYYAPDLHEGHYEMSANVCPYVCLSVHLSVAAASDYISLYNDEGL